MVSILIENGLVLTMDRGKKIIENGSVAIEGNRIVEVEKTVALKGRYEAERVINAEGKLVMPGLIDAHTHMESYLGKGLIENVPVIQWVERYMKWYASYLEDEDCYNAALGSCLEMIKTGTTCCIEWLTQTGQEQMSIRAVKDIGIRAVMGICAMDLFEPSAGAQPGFESYRESTEKCLKRIEAFIINNHNAEGGRIKAWINLLQTSNSSDELCKGVKQLAEEYEVGILTHAGVTKEYNDMDLAAFGMTLVKRFDRLGLLGQNLLSAHMGCITGEEFILVKERGVNVVHVVSASMHGAYGSVLGGLIPEMLSAGINVALGCDGANCGNFFDMVRQMNLVATAHKEVKRDPVVITPWQALEMATINGSKACLMENEIGSLEPGKKADIILFDLRRPEWTPVHRYNLVNNLVYSASGDSVDTVIIDGKIVMENRKMFTVNEAEVIEKAQQSTEQILKRAGFPKMEMPQLY